MPRWPLMLISAPSGPCTMPTVGASFTKSMKFRPLIGRFSTDCSSMSADCSDRVVSIVGVPAATRTTSSTPPTEQREVDAQRLPDREPDVGAAGGLESGELDGDGVGPERQRQSPIAAVAIRHQVPREARGLIAHPHLRPWEHGPRGIAHEAFDHPRRCRRLSGCAFDICADDDAARHDENSAPTMHGDPPGETTLVQSGVGLG